MSGGKSWYMGPVPDTSDALRRTEGNEPDDLRRLAQRISEPPPRPTNDDSGLIDIRALMAASQTMKKADLKEPPEAELTPPPLVRSLDIYPFGPPPAPEAPAPPPEPVRAKQFSPFGMTLLGFGLAALLGALGGVLWVNSNDTNNGPARVGVAAEGPSQPAQQSPVVDTAQDVSKPAPETEKHAAEEPEPTTETASVQTAKPVVTAAPIVKPPPRPVVKPPTTTTATPPKKSPCPAGDLMCEMKRATGQL